MLKLVESVINAPAAVPKSQTSAAYGRLHADILAGRYAPGEKLKIADLAMALGVRLGAIREALSRLVSDQLVIAQDQKGFIVAPLSIEDLEDLTKLRCEIEAIALREALAKGGEEWEAAVLAAAHRLRRTEMIGEDGALTAKWVERHAAMHSALVGPCGSRRLLDLHAQLYQQSERYRGLSVHIETGRSVADEHQALVDAALDRDAEKLVTLAVSHLRETTALIVKAARFGVTDAKSRG